MLCFRLECVIFKRQIFSNIIYLTALKISDRNKTWTELCWVELCLLQSFFDSEVRVSKCRCTWKRQKIPLILPGKPPVLVSARKFVIALGLLLGKELLPYFQKLRKRKGLSIHFYPIFFSLTSFTVSSDKKYYHVPTARLIHCSVETKVTRGRILQGQIFVHIPCNLWFRFQM